MPLIDAWLLVPPPVAGPLSLYPGVTTGCVAHLGNSSSPRLGALGSEAGVSPRLTPWHSAPLNRLVSVPCFVCPFASLNCSATQGVSLTRRAQPAPLLCRGGHGLQCRSLFLCQRLLWREPAQGPLGMYVCTAMVGYLTLLCCASYRVVSALLGAFMGMCLCQGVYCSPRAVHDTNVASALFCVLSLFMRTAPDECTACVDVAQCMAYFI